VTFVFCAVSFCVSVCNAQTAPKRSPERASPIALSRVLSWLPADTETLMVANGPFLIPLSETKIDEERTRLLSKAEINEKFEALPTSLVGLPEGLLKRLNGRKVALALEGSRHFRPPSGLGEMLYQGADLIVFDADIKSLGDAFIKDSKNGTAKLEEVEGQKVAVFQTQMEEDVWTSFVTFPKANVLIVATDREYLREALVRMNGTSGPRALPDTLPEWKYVDMKAHCWALRHYDKGQANSDPSSPFGDQKAANFPDDKAIGLVFNFDSVQGRTATITYLSQAKDILAVVQEGIFPSQSDPDSIKDLQIHYHEIAPGVVQGSFVLEHSEPVWYFTFVLMAILGHAVYV
jgi:hypothetical protein